jgi:hypothetical protein
MLQQILCGCMLQKVLAKLNLSTFYSWQQHLDVLYSLLMCLKTKFAFLPYLILSVSVYLPTRIIRDYSTFMVNHNFEVGPSARCDIAANAICKDIDIFNKDYILLMYA